MKDIMNTNNFLNFKSYDILKGGMNNNLALGGVSLRKIKFTAINGLGLLNKSSYINTISELKVILENLVRSKKNENNKAFFLYNKFYKALRFAKGLPIRGQRTHTNAQTSRRSKN